MRNKAVQLLQHYFVRAMGCGVVIQARVPWRHVQQFRIANAIQAGLLGRREVNRRLAPPDSLDDSELRVVVCLEANAQERRSP